MWAVSVVPVDAVPQAASRRKATRKGMRILRRGWLPLPRWNNSNIRGLVVLKHLFSHVVGTGRVDGDEGIAAQHSVPIGRRVGRWHPQVDQRSGQVGNG